MRTSILALTCLLLAIPCSADIIYVKEGGTGTGSSWPDAYGDLQDGLDDADPCDVIWVAAGTYYPTYGYGLGIGSRGKHFRMKNGVAIYGGFSDTGDPDMTDRDPNQYETILSGDIGTSGDNTDNCYHIFYHPSGTNLDTTAILDGFIVTAGNADGSGDHRNGGGMYNYQSSPTVTGCTFGGNLAAWAGGGMYNDDSSSPTVTGCTFNGNSSHYDISGGGGMYNLDSSSPTVTGCTFIGNTADLGGGMFNNHNSSPMVTNSIFGGNSASYYGGGIFNMGFSSPTMVNCTFGGNSAEFNGGGMLNQMNSSPTLTNCTFGGNLAGDYGGGMYNEWESRPILTNCILWGNTASVGNEIYNDMSAPEISYCDIAGSGGSSSWDLNLGLDGGGNIDVDPLFVDADGADNTPGTEDDNLRLLAGSQCIDAGDNSVVTTATDLNGNPRIANSTVDMGAYEFFQANTAPVADAGADQTVYACIDGMVQVKLDGSGSYDADGDELTYLWSWIIDSNEMTIAGVDPNIQLPIGEHTIELIVNDGTEDSVPNDVVITVIGPIAADVHIVPRVINRRSRMRRIYAVMQLPAGASAQDLADEPFMLEPAGIASSWQRVFGWSNRKKIFISFDKSDVTDALTDNGNVELTIIGKLESGQCIQGSDTVRIIKPPRQRGRWRKPNRRK